MKQQQTKVGRRSMVVLNYLCLIVMNVCFYFVYYDRDMTHMVDVIGILALIIAVLAFIRVHLKSGLWKLTHTKAENLDERELQITHSALSHAYAWFTIICLSIMLVHAVFSRLFLDLDFAITVPLVSSLIYLAHTLPGSILAWTENRVPGDAV